MLAAVVGWLPGDRIGQLPEALLLPGRDLVLHAVGFCFLTLTFRGWRGPRTSTSRWLPGAVVILVLFALIHEAAQGLVPGRHRDLQDLMADLMGILVGTAISLLIFPGKSEGSTE
ncbi:MAG: VanZ family protein [Planctomycetota bacterium]|nr:VanZ family protein [Planctomycetota bacterium]